MRSAATCGTGFPRRPTRTCPSPGSIDFWNPYTEADETFAIPAGGTGYYRTASLIACWSSAPFFHNNALGKFTGDPSVAGRMEAFNDAVQKLLWPEKRLGKDSIWRTEQECQFTLHSDYLPDLLKKALAGRDRPGRLLPHRPHPRGHAGQSPRQRES